jgi:hypothetical protein
MAKKKDNKWTQPEAPPPPLFTGKKERDLVKQVNDELIERVIGQALIYYPISREHTRYHPVYGEAITKTFLAPIHVHALVKWEGMTTKTEVFGVDRLSSIEVHFHKRRLVEDQDMFVREGDFLQYGDQFYEILTLNEPKQLFGQIENRFEIVAKCMKSRTSVFNAK